jgi:hypothetical protein
MPGSAAQSAWALADGNTAKAANSASDTLAVWGTDSDDRSGAVSIIAMARAKRSKKRGAFCIISSGITRAPVPKTQAAFFYKKAIFMTSLNKKEKAGAPPRKQFCKHDSPPIFILL